VTDLGPHIERIARRLLGEPNAKLSTGVQLRFGTHGSVAVEIGGADRGKWFDHEHDVGGGPLDLLRLKGGVVNGEAVEWLRSELGIDVGRPDRRRIAATYDYRDERADLLYQAVRFEPKGFAQRRPDGRGSWIWKLGDTRRVPYRLPELLAEPNRVVFIAEGEKDVERLRSLGLVATCNSEGAGKWKLDFAKHFRGRQVVILPDNDDTGRDHARAIVSKLAPVAEWIRVVNLPGLPPKGDIADWLNAGGGRDQLEQIVEATTPIEGSKPNTPFELVRFDDMRPRLADSYLIKHLLGTVGMTVLYGESGSGKTFLALHMSFYLAAGTECFGRRVRRCGVVYIAAEAGRSIENRIAAAKTEVEFPGVMPFAAIVSPVDLCSDDVDLSKLIITIKAAELGMPVGLIVVDTLSRVMAGGNENAPEDMGALVRNIDRLRAETGATVLLVHHSGKDTSKGARGHSLLRAAADTEIEVTRDEATKIATARVTKQRELPTEGLLTFALRQVELGSDADGDPITSCVVEPVADTEPSERRQKLTGTAKAAFDNFLNCMAEQAEELPASMHIPASVTGVTLKAWRNHLEHAAIINRDGNPREQFRRIRVTLQERGFIGVWGRFAWPSRRVTSVSQ
jgi:hypothetical protein